MGNSLAKEEKHLPDEIWDLISSFSMTNEQANLRKLNKRISNALSINVLGKYKSCVFTEFDRAGIKSNQKYFQQGLDDVKEYLLKQNEEKGFLISEFKVIAPALVLSVRVKKNVYHFKLVPDMTKLENKNVVIPLTKWSEEYFGSCKSAVKKGDSIVLAWPSCLGSSGGHTYFDGHIFQSSNLPLFDDDLGIKVKFDEIKLSLNLDEITCFGNLSNDEGHWKGLDNYKGSFLTNKGNFNWWPVTQPDLILEELRKFVTAKLNERDEHGYHPNDFTVTQVVMSILLQKNVTVKNKPTKKDLGKFFSLCLYPSSTLPSFWIVTPTKTVRAYPQIYFDKDHKTLLDMKKDFTPLKYQIYKPKNYQDCDKILDCLKDKNSNDLNQIVDTLTHKDNGFVFYKPMSLEEWKEEKKIEKEEKRGEKENKQRGLDFETNESASVNIEIANGVKAQVLLDAGGCVDDELLASMSGAPSGSIFLQEKESGVFVPMNGLCGGCTYLLHTAPLSKAGDTTVATSGSTVAAPKNSATPAPATKLAVAPSSSLTQSAATAFGNLMESDSELQHFLAQNWKDSSEMIKRLGRPAHVLEDAGLKTWADLKALDQASFEALSLPIALKKLLAQEVAARLG